MKETGMTQSPDPSPTLPRRIGLTGASLIVMGNIIGIGIFISTGFVAEHVGSPAMLFLAWFAGGLLSMAGAMSYAELGASMPHAGGDYNYLRKAYGPLAGFLSGWSSFLITFSGSIATFAVGFSDSADLLFPTVSLKQQLLGPITVGQLVAIGIIFVFSLFNYVGVRVGGMIQNLLTFFKVSAIFLLVFCGFWKGSGSLGNFSPFLGNAGNGSTLAGFGLALIPVLFTYQGWNATTYIAGEIKEPGRNIPGSILIGIVSVLLLYLCVNAVYLYALPLAKMKGVLGIADAASTALFGPNFSNTLSALIALSILGALSTNILIAPRIYYAMARDGLFIPSAAKVHKRFGTPSVSIMVQCLWSSALVLVGGFEQLLTYVVFVIVLFSALTTSSVFVLRKKFPEMPRPYRVWGYPFVPAAYVLFSVLIMLNTLIERPTESVLGLLMVGLGVPVYRYWVGKEFEIENWKLNRFKS